MNRKEIRAEMRKLRAEEKLKKAQQKVAELVAATKQQKMAEPHRNHHLITLGAEEHRWGLRADHAPARLALRSMTLPLYVGALEGLYEADDTLSVAELEAKYLLEHHETLKVEGQRIVLQREMDAYAADCRRWEERQKSMNDSLKWRAGRVSMRQAWLVERTCQFLELEHRPKLETCGDAHDWLSEHGANLRLKAEVGSGPCKAGRTKAALMSERGGLFGSSELTRSAASNAADSDEGLPPTSEEDEHA